MVDFLERLSPHPRPLLPFNIGNPVSYSVTTVSRPYLHIPGYFEPFYVDLSTCTSVYLTYVNGGVRGIFTQGGPGREEVVLGNKAKVRTVKLYGLILSEIPYEIAFVQVSSY